MKGITMTKLDITKTVVSTIVGIGTAQIITAISINNTQPQKVTDKVTVTAGSVVMGYIAADVTREYTNRKIDEIANWWKKNVTG